MRPDPVILLLETYPKEVISHGKKGSNVTHRQVRFPRTGWSPVGRRWRLPFGPAASRHRGRAARASYSTPASSRAGRSLDVRVPTNVGMEAEKAWPSPEVVRRQPPDSKARLCKIYMVLMLGKGMI